MCPMIESLLPSHARGELDVMDAFSVNLHLERCESCRGVFDRLSREKASREGGGAHRANAPSDLSAVRMRSSSWERRAAPSLAERLRIAWGNLGRPWKAALAGAAAAGVLAIPIAKLPGLGAEPVVLASREVVEPAGEVLLAPLPKTPVPVEIAVAPKPRRPRKISKMSQPPREAVVRKVASRPVRRPLAAAPAVTHRALPLAEPVAKSEPVAFALIHGLGPEPVAVAVTKPVAATAAAGHAVIWNAGPEPLFVPVRAEPAEIRAQVEF